MKTLKYWLGLALLLAAVSASAQIRSHKLNINIPFSFMAAGRSWDAGKYVMGVDTGTGAVTIRATSGTERLTLSIAGDPQDFTKAYAKFHRYGGTFFLSQVAVDGVSRNIEYSKAEKRLIAHQKPAEEKVVAALR